MQETFPDKRRGEKLAAKHVNKLNRAARQVTDGSIVSGLHGVDGRVLGYPDWQQRVAVVTAVDGDTGEVTARRRYWDGSAWATVPAADEPSFEVDPDALGQTLAVDDQIVVFWDEQRGLWIPVPALAPADTVREGTLASDLAPAASALDEPSTATLNAYVWDDDAGTLVADSTQDVTVTNRFTEINTIPSGTWVVANKINGEWRPVAADCETTLLLEESSSSSSAS